jgi:hypothetical protein
MRNIKTFNLKYGNCFIYCLLFKVNNWNKSKMFMRPRKIRGIYLLSSHIIYNNEYKIFYRSRPKGNMTSLFFKGRPQIIKLDKLKKENVTKNT